MSTAFFILCELFVNSCQMVLTISICIVISIVITEFSKSHSNVHIIIHRLQDVFEQL